MEVEPAVLTATPTSDVLASTAPAGDTGTADSIEVVPAGSSRPTPARRQLRARPSDPAPTTSPKTKRSRPESSTTLRKGTDHEINYIRSKLAPEHVHSRRNVVIKEKEAELKHVIDQHDTAVREKFHLERYISIFEGWNPKVSTIYHAGGDHVRRLTGQDAKQDNSPVFMEVGAIRPILAQSV